MTNCYFSINVSGNASVFQYAETELLLCTLKELENSLNLHRTQLDYVDIAISFLLGIEKQIVLLRF